LQPTIYGRSVILYPEIVCLLFCFRGFSMKHKIFTILTVGAMTLNLVVLAGAAGGARAS
jgi:hypothetical protein